MKPKPRAMEGWGKRFEDFWLPLITTKGKLSLRKIKNELHDWDFVMREVPIVYDHVAGLSKVMYDAKTIIAEHDSRCHEFCVDIDDYKQELSRREEEVAEDICKLIDDVELGYKNTSLEEWKVFKHIRNAIRDKYIAVEKVGGEK